MKLAITIEVEIDRLQDTKEKQRKLIQAITDRLCDAVKYVDDVDRRAEVLSVVENES